MFYRVSNGGSSAVILRSSGSFGSNHTLSVSETVFAYSAGQHPYSTITFIELTRSGTITPNWKLTCGSDIITSISLNARYNIKDKAVSLVYSFSFGYDGGTNCSYNLVAKLE